MECHVCGADLEPVVTDLPFKVNQKKIVIVEDLPVHQCSQCREFLLEDRVMARVETILETTGVATKLGGRQVRRVSVSSDATTERRGRFKSSTLRTICTQSEISRDDFLTGGQHAKRL